MTETEKFLSWYESEKEKGIVDIRFFVGDLSKATPETFFKEANEINQQYKDGKFVERKDIF